MERVDLEPEQEGLFCQLVEAYRAVQRSDREDFTVFRNSVGAALQGNGFFVPAVIESDLLALQDSGLISETERAEGHWSFRIPQRGLTYYGALKELGTPVAQLEREMLRRLTSDEFLSRYPRASARWGKALETMWSGDVQIELGAVGLLCRETVQEFVTELLQRLDLQPESPDKAKTRDRFSQAVNSQRERLGASTSDMLDALFNWWRAVCDLVQRQVHLREKGGELSWKDGRRVVFATGTVMHEADRALAD